MRLPEDDNYKVIQFVAVGLGTALAGGGTTATSGDQKTGYQLSAITDTYWAVTLATDSTTVTASNGNYLKSGAYVYVYVPQGYRIKVDAAASASCGLCF